MSIPLRPGMHYLAFRLRATERYASKAAPRQATTFTYPLLFQTLRNRRKNQIPPLPRSPFPKHTPATFFPLRVLWQGSSLGESLHVNDAALTGRNGTQGHSLAFNGGCVWGTFACAGLPVFHRSVNPYAAATHLFDSRSCAALSGIQELPC